LLVPAYPPYRYSFLLILLALGNQNNPKLYVNSGDEVTVEMVTHMAGDYYDGMVKGDPALEGIYHWTNKVLLSADELLFSSFKLPAAGHHIDEME
jgi:hypothetical protein